MRIDVAERLDVAGPGEPLGNELGLGHVSGVQLRNTSVSDGVVVAHVITTLPRSCANGLDRQQRNGHHDDVARSGRLIDRAGCCTRAQLRHEIVEGVRSTRVGIYDVDARRHRQSGDR
jgi:hypothetical protein